MIRLTPFVFPHSLIEVEEDDRTKDVSDVLLHVLGFREEHPFMYLVVEEVREGSSFVHLPIEF